MSGRDLQLPPGFRFHPTDEELVTHYLCRKCAAMPIAVPIIAEVDLYKHDPWRLPGMAAYGEKEWYFFSPRDRKYPNGSRPNRAAGSGYWKATGADKPIGGAKPVAIKKALVFYAGKAPKGMKTNWIMHEYRLADVDRTIRRKNSLRLDDWVLCRIYNKKGNAEKPSSGERKPGGLRSNRPPPPESEAEQKRGIPSHPYAPPLPPLPHVPQLADLVYFEASDSMPRLHADSSCSEHVISPEFAACEREVQSRPRWANHERSLTQFECGPLASGFLDPLQDIFMHLQKPF